MSQATSKLQTEILISKLNEMKSFGGPAITSGLSDDVIEDFLDDYDALAVAIERAYEVFDGAREDHPDFLALSEVEQIEAAQDGYTNFYAEDAVNPYVAAAAAGPWLVSLKGAVIYDCGGYGMLGLGHAPGVLLDAMDQPHVMANIMTASISQLEFIRCLRSEIGHTRAGGTPFTSFLCLNSGSESTTMASRIADINTKNLTDPGARYEGRDIHGITLEGSFHGRTDRPARYSDSTLGNYQKHLASYRDSDYLLTVTPNDIESLEAAFAKAEDDGVFIEAFFMEPVMGEGNPGQAGCRLYSGRAARLWSIIHRRLSGLRGPRRTRYGSLLEVDQWRSIPVVGSRFVRSSRINLPNRAIRQYDDNEPARPRCRNGDARMFYTGASPKYSRSGKSAGRRPERHRSRSRKRNHRDTGNRTIAELRTQSALQVPWR